LNKLQINSKNQNILYGIVNKFLGVLFFYRGTGADASRFCWPFGGFDASRFCERWKVFWCADLPVSIDLEVSIPIRVVSDLPGFENLAGLWQLPPPLSAPINEKGFAKSKFAPECEISIPLWCDY
jgi:hypothetical protein